MTIDIINFFISTVGTVIPIVCAVLLCAYDIREDMEKSYFKHIVRMSFPSSCFVVFDDNEEVNESMLMKTFNKKKEELTNFFSLRTLNDKQAAKLKFYRNNMIKYPIKLYSKMEKRFIPFNVYILIQQGDENSLLKRGIYVSVIRDGVVSPKFVLHSSFFYAGLPFKNIHYLDDYGTFFKIEDAHISTNKNHKAEGCSNLKNFMIGLDNDCDYFQLNSLDEAGKKKLIDSFFHLIETIIKGYFCMFIEPNKYDANKKELMCRKFNFTKMENYR